MNDQTANENQEQPEEVILTADPVKEPAEWLCQFQEALGILAEGLCEIISFDAERDRELARSACSQKAPEAPIATKTIQRVLNRLRATEGEEAVEKAIQRYGLDKPKEVPGKDEWWATHLEAGLFTVWPPVIWYARDLREALQGATSQSEAVAAQTSLVRDALTQLNLIISRGTTMIEEWKSSCSIKGYDTDDVVYEVLIAAGAFSDFVREQEIRPKLRTLAVLPVQVVKAGESNEAERAKDASIERNTCDVGADAHKESILVNRSNTIELPRLCKPMRTEDLAEIFRVSSRTIQRRIRAGALSAEPHGRKWRVPLSILPAEYVQKITQK